MDGWGPSGTGSTSRGSSYGPTISSAPDGGVAEPVENSGAGGPDASAEPTVWGEFRQGIKQGAVNIANGVQDAVIGLANLAIAGSPVGQIAAGLGVGSKYSNEAEPNVKSEIGGNRRGKFSSARGVLRAIEEAV